MQHKSYEELHQTIFGTQPDTQPSLSTNSSHEEIATEISPPPHSLAEKSSIPASSDVTLDDSSNQDRIPGAPDAQETKPTSRHNCHPPLDPRSFPNQPRKESHQIPATIDNVDHLLAAYDVYVRYDVIRKKILITILSLSGPTDNFDNTARSFLLSIAALNGMSTNKLLGIVELLAEQRPFNPVAEWILMIPWDGKDRLSDICETVTERDDYPVHLKNILICKWLLSAVAAALLPTGFKTRGVLTFQGPQGIGKTSWVMSLVPDPNLREVLVKVDHHLDPSNKDSILGAIAHWIVEIGELDSSFKRDIARLKGFLTSNSDKIRRPYAHTHSEYSRRTVFFASVNEDDFLVDKTGNSRWWTIPVTAIDYNHEIDMQQVFAQLAEDLKKGKQWWLTAEEEHLLEEYNREHRSVSVIREQLLNVLDLQLGDRDGSPAMTATEILKHLGYNNPSNAKAKECASILRELLGNSKRIHGLNKWRIPLKRISATNASTTGHRQLPDKIC